MTSSARRRPPVRWAPAGSGSGSGSRTGTFELPLDIQEQAVGRLGAFSLAFARLLAISFVTRRIGVHRGLLLDVEYLAIANATTISLTAILVIVGLTARGGWLPARVTLRLGLLLEVVASLGVAFLDRVLFDFGEPPIRLSFAVMVMLTFPLVVPTPLAPRIATTFLSAAMIPVAVFLGTMVGKPSPDLVFAITALQPTLLVAILGILGSRIVYRMGVQVHEARQLGSYELVERLGSGGMGEVWRAKHRMLVRPAAVKLIRPDRLGVQPETSIRRFEREAQATGALRSPHTVELYDFGITDDGTFYYAMELLEGLDLDSLVKRHGPLPANRTVHILKQICRSLADAHARGLVHRDIKPANIFLCTLGSEWDFTKVLDFGLVKPSPGDALDVTGASVAGSPMGTPSFLAPEIALGETADGRADLYSLGCVAYWLITGAELFPEDTAMKVIMAHVNAAPEPPSVRGGRRVPASLESIVMQCLEKRPDQRPASALEIHRRLETCGIDPAWTEEDAIGWWTEQRLA